MSTREPKTLGEYRDLCVLLGGEHCTAVKFFDEKIAKQGRDEEVLADPRQMMFVIGTMLAEDWKKADDQPTRKQ